MSGDIPEINSNSSSNVSDGINISFIRKQSELRTLFGEFFSDKVTGSDIGQRMHSGRNTKHYSPMEIVSGLKNSFTSADISPVESEKFQEFLNAIDETNAVDIYNMFGQKSITTLITDDVMSSPLTRKDSVMKIFDAIAKSKGIDDPQVRTNFETELYSQFRKQFGFNIKCDKLDKMLQDMIQS